MIKDKKKDKKKCTKKGKIMLAYGVCQLGSRLVSAFALLAIAFGLSELTKESTLFNQCVEEVRENGQSYSASVHFCHGGS